MLNQNFAQIQPFPQGKRSFLYKIFASPEIVIILHKIIVSPETVIILHKNYASGRAILQYLSIVRCIHSYPHSLFSSITHQLFHPIFTYWCLRIKEH
jgi:hypothetical protein